MNHHHNEQKELEKHKKMLKMAKFVGGEYSKDLSTKVGAIIVGKDKEIISLGYNGFPRGANDEIMERYERPLKYVYTEHAERNAIYNAARIGVSLKGASLYVHPLPPCHECARAIIQTGIKEVYVETLKVPERWQDSINQAVEMMTECGVKIHELGIVS